MDIVSFRTPGLGDQSYLLVHDGQGILVDPQRDIDRFLSVARDRDVRIRMVLETHLHNDYVSGGEQAALTTGAELVLPASAAAAYRHRPAFHLEDIEDEAFTVRPIHTPGHTPEHTSYLVIIDGRPAALFSGGSLLVGSVGRPDLLGMERAMTLGRLQHLSVNRLARLDPEVGLFPTHGAGSFCTASGASKYTSTIGDEVASSPLLRIADPDEFAASLIASPMPIPAFYRFMGPANTLGVPAFPHRELPELTVADLAGLSPDTRVIDIRSRAAQAAGHLPGSQLIALTDDFGSWAGWLGDYRAPIVLVTDADTDPQEAVTQLAQIGIDDVRGVVRDLSGAELRSFDLLTVRGAADAVAAGDQVLDVRMPNEVREMALEGATVRFVADLVGSGVPEGLDPHRPVLIVCASGRRAAIAAGVLLDAGFTQVRMLGGAGVAEVVEKLAARAAV